MNMRELWTKAKFRGCRREFYISFLPSLLAYITGLNTALRNVQGNGKNIHLFSELFVLEYKHLQHSTPPPQPHHLPMYQSERRKWYFCLDHHFCQHQTTWHPDPHWVERSLWNSTPPVQVEPNPNTSLITMGCLSLDFLWQWDGALSSTGAEVRAGCLCRG